MEGPPAPYPNETPQCLATVVKGLGLSTDRDLKGTERGFAKAVELELHADWNLLYGCASESGALRRYRKKLGRDVPEARLQLFVI